MRKIIMAGIAASAGLGASLGPCGLAAAEETLKAGEWEATTTMDSGDMPMAPGPQTVRFCIKQEDIDKGLDKVFEENLQKQGTCKTGDSKMGGGEMMLNMSCESRGGTMKMRATGTYSPTAYTISSDLDMNMGGMAMKMSSVTKAKYIGPCKK